MKSITPHAYPEIVEIVNQSQAAAAGFRDKFWVRWLRNCTMESIEPYLKYHLYQEQIGCEMTFGGFDSIRQDLETLPERRAGAPYTATVLAIFADFGFVRSQELLHDPEAAISWLRGLFADAASRCGHTVIVNTWIPPVHVLKAPGGSSFDNCVQQVNAFIREFVKQHSSQFALADWDRLARCNGEANTFDRRFLYSAKAPFTNQFLSSLAFETSRILRLASGRVKKVLVLDCDGTLWGGILGEDGPSALQIDRWEYPGNIFYRFQHTVLALHDQGVLVTLCSKNDESAVLDFIETSPQCLIKKRHLAGWRINWRNKAENLADLASELNLGLDSFVFVDDSPTECALVKEMLPAVTVVQVPERRHELPELLARHGYFDSNASTGEDNKRTALYKQEGLRREARASFSNIDEYLSNLQLKAEICDVRPDELPRVAQLIQKTNQFNLTTIRQSESELERMLSSNETSIFRIRPSDRFGDYGITGVLIARLDGSRAYVDTFLLSCRILERRFEFVFLDHVLKTLETRWPLKEWYASYAPTPKNSLVANFWDQLGFKPLIDDGKSKTYTVTRGEWRLPCRTDFITTVSLNNH